MIFDTKELITILSQMLNTVEIHILTWLIVIDIFSGFVKGFAGKQANSTKGLLGIVKHFLVILLVYTFYPYLILLDAKPIAVAFVLFFVGAYGISVVENYGQLGLPMPSFVKAYFEKLKRVTDQGQSIQLNLDAEKIATGILDASQISADLDKGIVEFKPQDKSNEEVQFNDFTIPPWSLSAPCGAIFGGNL